MFASSFASSRSRLIGVQTAYNASTDILSYVGVGTVANSGPSVIVVFRGTNLASIKNIMEDLNLSTPPFPRLL